MKALQGIRILDLTHMLSGPYAGMMLADLGAETIKVEPPVTGEGTRRLLEHDSQNSLHGFGAYFLTLNRNKKSITLNLKSDQGKQIFYRLVEKADVVLSNFSAGVTARLQIDHEHLASRNPRLITCSVTGFGETGPARNLTAFDMVAQAMGGGMSITGQPGDPPTRSGIPIGDLGGGLMGVIGVLAALQARHLTGRGQHVDISMLDAQISLLNYMVTMYFLSGVIPDRLGNGHFVHVPYDAFSCADGHIIIAIIADNFWQELLKIVSAADLDIEENKYQPGRLKNKTQINQRLNEILSTQTQHYWLEKLRAARIPCAPVYNLQQAVQDEQILARHMIVEVPHPCGGSARMPGNPIKLSDTYTDTFSPPPLLGQHNREVYQQLLGLSEEELTALQENGVI
ncbi:MAG: CoA transferase [Chloroflexi bacterium]|nr:CoA transferase [Ardenticatenaceae bacterium]MBL1127922.1 CoA transferase [Chloroflexota bacterium]NOG33992.1 CoA transferase [Chloroflexota bacterium]GIK55678.1 MAG: CoA transferase [Chloroflexota bacterium]